MFKVKLKDIDELNDILSRFKVITCLYSLVAQSNYSGMLSEDNMEVSYSDVYYLLFDLLYENVLRFNQLLEREDFKEAI